MTPEQLDDLTARLLKRAEIRRQIPGRKSVENGEPDRIADLLEEAAKAITFLRPAPTFEHNEAPVSADLKLTEDFANFIIGTSIPFIQQINEWNGNDDLFDANPHCIHDVVGASGGGVKCTKCTGWFCY